MRTVAITCSLLGLLFSSAVLGDEPKATEIDGTWELQKSMEGGGKWVDETAAKFVAVRRDGIQTITKDGTLFSRRRFSVDLSSSPKSVDLDDLEDAEKKIGRTLGIYELEGDTLKLALPSDPSKRSTDRPKDFEEDGSKWLYLDQRAEE